MTRALRPRATLLLALVAAAAGGCGEGRYRLGGVGGSQNLGGASGGSGGSGSVGAGGSAGALPELQCGSCSEGAECELIDDMEDANMTILLEHGRSGFWYAFNDMTPDAEQEPSSNADLFPMDQLDPQRGGSKYAARTAGEGFRVWGAGIAFDLLSKSAYDGSAYSGVTFVARSQASREIRFDVADVTTVPYANQCMGDLCYDNFGAQVQLGPSWERFRFDWAELKQQGWGRPQSNRVDETQLFAMRFQVSGAEPFEFWIDDVAFLCAR